MDSEQLLALAARCEQATGSIIELDRAISLAVTPYTVVIERDHPVYKRPCIERTVVIERQAYTASVDAAMTLIPADHEWGVNWGGNSCAEVVPLPDGEPIHAYAATPALALTAASLRALAASMKDGTHG